MKVAKGKGLGNSTTNPEVDAFLSRAKTWQDELNELRTILLDCHLTEGLKWGKPCYAFEGHNIVVLQPFKEYCAVLFFKGALLKDPRGILVKTGENTQVGRQIRFTDVREIVKWKTALKAYVHEAVEAEKGGLKVTLKKNLELPGEFKNRLEELPNLKAAFDALTPGRQRAYSFYFSAPKQSKTRETRIDKCVPQILAGKGFLERV